MSGQENPESPQVKLMHEWGRGYVERDIDLIAANLHKDYHHIIYPRSLGMPEETREQYLQHMKGVIPLWSDNEVIYQLLPELYIPSNDILSAVDSQFDYRSSWEGCRPCSYP